MVTANLIKELRERTQVGMSDCKKALVECNGDMDKAIEWLREKGLSGAVKKQGRIAAEGLTNVIVEGNTAVILEINSETDFVAKNDKFKHLVELFSNELLSNDVNTLEEALAIKHGDETLNDILIANIAVIGEKISFRRFQRVIKTDNQVFGAYKHMGGKISALTILEGNDEEVAKDVSMQSAALRAEYITRNEVPEERIKEEENILKEQTLSEGKSIDIAEKMVQGRLNKFFKEICLIEQQFIKDSNVTIEQLLKNSNSKIVNVIRYEVGEGIEKKQEDFRQEVMKQINE